MATYDLLNKTVQQEIFTGHKVTSPMLFGVKTEGQLGGRAELREASELFQNTYVNAKQQSLEEVVNYLLKFNDIVAELEIKKTEPISFQFSEQIISTNMTQDEIREKLGLAPIEAARADVSAALDLRDYAKNWFSSAGVPTGILKTAQSLNLEQAEAVTANWHNKQQNRQVAVLGNGFDYQPIALSPREALFTDIVEQNIVAIARLFGIPARMLISSIPGGSDTYSNVQDEAKVFYQTTLSAYTDAISDALSNCLPRGTRVEFDWQHLFRADVAARYSYYATGIAAGFLTIEEVREKEGLNA